MKGNRMFGMVAIIAAVLVCAQSLHAIPHDQNIKKRDGKDCSGNADDIANLCLTDLGGNTGAEDNDCGHMEASLKCLLPCSKEQKWKGQYSKSLERFSDKCPKESKSFKESSEDSKSNESSPESKDKKDDSKSKSDDAKDEKEDHKDSKPNHNDDKDKHSSKGGSGSKKSHKSSDSDESTEDDHQTKTTINPAQLYRPTGDPRVFGEAPATMSANLAITFATLISAMLMLA